MEINYPFLKTEVLMEYPSYAEKSSSRHLSGGRAKEKVWCGKRKPTRLESRLGSLGKFRLHPLIHTLPEFSLPQDKGDDLDKNFSHRLEIGSDISLFIIKMGLDSSSNPLILHGGRPGDRTRDLWFRRPTLYPLS